MLRRASFAVVLFALAAFAGGCKVKTYKGTTIRTHEGLVHEFCSEKGGYVQVNIDGCSIPNFPFYGELFATKDGASYAEWKTLRDGQQVRFDRKLVAGQCGSVNIVNMDDGDSVTCNFHVYWDL